MRVEKPTEMGLNRDLKVRLILDKGDCLSLGIFGTFCKSFNVTRCSRFGDLCPCIPVGRKGCADKL